MPRKQVFKIRWKVSPLRKDKRTGPIDPIPRSDYLKMLFSKTENGGFKNEKRR